MSIRIATVYRDSHFDSFAAYDMSMVRWLRISEALAARNYEVDMIINGNGLEVSSAPGVRVVSYEQVDWKDYDVIKTLFHKGFDSLQAAGGSDHPCVISKLGSVVGSHDGYQGVHFTGHERQRMYETQIRINKHSRWVTLLTEPSRDLWVEMFEDRAKILMVPTGADERIPARLNNPFQDTGDKTAIFVGNLYTDTQSHINRLWQQRLNELGIRLIDRGVRLYVIGPGTTDILNPEYVTCLGCIPHESIWQYQYFSNVGIILAQGPEQHNESSKLYYYLRAGLPVVSEHPVPNNHLITDCNLGYVADYGDVDSMADMIVDAAHRVWNPEHAVRHIVQHHTWGKRAEVYAAAINSTVQSATG